MSARRGGARRGGRGGRGRGGKRTTARTTRPTVRKKLWTDAHDARLVQAVVHTLAYTQDGVWGILKRDPRLYTLFKHFTENDIRLKYQQLLTANDTSDNVVFSSQLVPVFSEPRTHDMPLAEYTPVPVSAPVLPPLYGPHFGVCDSDDEHDDDPGDTHYHEHYNDCRAKDAAIHALKTKLDSMDYHVHVMDAHYRHLAAQDTYDPLEMVTAWNPSMLTGGYMNTPVDKTSTDATDDKSTTLTHEQGGVLTALLPYPFLFAPRTLQDGGGPSTLAADVLPPRYLKIPLDGARPPTAQTTASPGQGSGDGMDSLPTPPCLETTIPAHNHVAPIAEEFTQILSDARFYYKYRLYPLDLTKMNPLLYKKRLNQHHISRGALGLSVDRVLLGAHNNALVGMYTKNNAGLLAQYKRYQAYYHQQKQAAEQRALQARFPPLKFLVQQAQPAAPPASPAGEGEHPATTPGQPEGSAAPAAPPPPPPPPSPLPKDALKLLRRRSKALQRQLTRFPPQPPTPLVTESSAWLSVTAPLRLKSLKTFLNNIVGIPLWRVLAICRYLVLCPSASAQRAVLAYVIYDHFAHNSFSSTRFLSMVYSAYRHFKNTPLWCFWFMNQLVDVQPSMTQQAIAHALRQHASRSGAGGGDASMADGDDSGVFGHH